MRALGIALSLIAHGAALGWLMARAPQPDRGVTRQQVEAVSLATVPSEALNARETVANAEAESAQQAAPEPLAPVPPPELAPPAPDEPMPPDPPAVAPAEPLAIIAAPDSAVVAPPPARPDAPPPPRAAAQSARRRAERLPAPRRPPAPAETGRAAAAASGPPPSASYGEMSAYAAMVRARIAARTPRLPGGGRVMVAFRITQGGALVGARVARSSGNAGADGAALRAVRSGAPYPAPPRGAGVIAFSVPFDFR